MQSRTPPLLGLLLLSLTGAISCHWSEKRVARIATPTAPVSGVVAAVPAEPMLNLSAPPAIAQDEPELWAATLSAYARNDDHPLWFEHGLPRPQIQGLRDAIEHIAGDGMDPSRYQLSAVRKLAVLADDGQPLGIAELTDADLSLSLAAIKLARDLQQGIMLPPEQDRRWAKSDPIDLGALVFQSARSADVESALRTLTPQHPQYQLLRAALTDYRALARRTVWPLVPESARVKPGKSASEIPAIRARLTASDHLQATVSVPPAVQAVDTAPATPVSVPVTTAVAIEAPSARAESSDVLDEELMDAIKQFQREHGLNEDGIPGTETLAAMNVPLSERVRQLELNLERWRWLPEQLGETHVLVNVPTFELTAVEAGQTALKMRVVTGTQRTPTPIFHGAIETVVLSPYWNVPRSILQGEVRPGLAKDPGYLRRKNMEVLRNGKLVDLGSVSLKDPSVRVRQRPGPGNSLGNVKFLFPNEFNVYLHDTPSDSLFARAERSLSHGCVRLEKPFEMARWVLQHDPEWTDENIQAAMDSGRERHVRLATQIPVYIVYQTAWVNDDGMLVFAKDLYGHDSRQAQTLPVATPGTMYAQEVVEN